MKGLFGLVGLVVVLALVAWLTQRQLTAMAPVPAMPGAASGTASGATVREQAQGVQQQTRQAVEALMQQPRPAADGQ